jgi:isopenicillin N synthase-like dioxygenase
MIIYTPPKTPETIPLIDLTDAFSPQAERRKAVAWRIHQAARETGFFYIENHGVPEALMRGQLDWARRYFDLPLERKMALDIADSPIMRGYEPMASQTLDEGSPPDLKEGFMLARDLGEDHPLVRSGAPFEGPNRWPAGLPGFREQIEAYQAAMMGLGRRLVSCLALSLDLDEDYFAEAMEEPSCTVRLLHYPPQPADARFNQIGSGAHTDWGLITILLQDEAGGLEVLNADGDWIRAEPIPGTFVVNLGDMVPRVTNGLYHSNMHRVLNNAGGRDRYSSPTFFNPNYFYSFDCAPTCRDLADVPPPRTTFGEHVQEMFRKTYQPAA